MPIQEGNARRTSPVGILTPSRLHGKAGRVAGNTIGWDSIFILVLGRQRCPAVRICPRQVEQVHPGEDDQKAAEQRDGADGVSSIEAFEENERGTEGSCREGDIIQRIDTGIELASRPSNWLAHLTCLSKRHLEPY